MTKVPKTAETSELLAQIAQHGWDKVIHYDKIYIGNELYVLSLDQTAYFLGLQRETIYDPFVGAVSVELYHHIRKTGWAGRIEVIENTAFHLEADVMTQEGRQCLIFVEIFDVPAYYKVTYPTQRAKVEWVNGQQAKAFMVEAASQPPTTDK